ncbi:MAG: type II secretion system protein [Rhodocyclaceae bacterium]|nr:type II secretion system protein [Rhodocyclaceae bacterium]
MVTRNPLSQSHGFTLLEAIIAITLLGILGGVVATFIKSPVDAYVAQGSRAVLTDAADGALRRVTRDVAAALPNSLRSISGGGSTACFELIPVLAGGRYRNQTSATGTGDVLDFATTDTSFDVLGQIRMANLPTGTNLVAIHNLGISGADAYAGDNTASISAASTTAVTLAAGKKFPFLSPNKAFSVIPSNSVVYTCTGSTLLRSTRAFTGTAPTLSLAQLGACPVTGTTLVSNVSNCSFSYTPAVNQRDGILSISLALTLNSETVTLYDQVMVNNAP